MLLSSSLRLHLIPFVCCVLGNEGTFYTAHMGEDILVNIPIHELPDLHAGDTLTLVAVLAHALPIPLGRSGQQLLRRPYLSVPQIQKPQIFQGLSLPGLPHVEPFAGFLVGFSTPYGDITPASSGSGFFGGSVFRSKDPKDSSEGKRRQWETSSDWLKEHMNGTTDYSLWYGKNPEEDQEANMVIVAAKKLGQLDAGYYQALAYMGK